MHQSGFYNVVVLQQWLQLAQHIRPTSSGSVYVYLFRWQRGHFLRSKHAVLAKSENVNESIHCFFPPHRTDKNKPNKVDVYCQCSAFLFSYSPTRFHLPTLISVSIRVFPYRYSLLFFCCWWELFATTPSSWPVELLELLRYDTVLY